MDEMNLGPEAQELHDSIVAEIQSGVLKLKDGLPFGTGDETEMQYDVTLRELTAGDMIDAQAAAEKLVMSKEGPVLVSSPSRMGLEMLRRQIASVGCIKGPLSMALIRKLSVDDFQRLSLVHRNVRHGCGGIADTRTGASGCGAGMILRKRRQRLALF